MDSVCRCLIQNAGIRIRIKVEDMDMAWGLLGVGCWAAIVAALERKANG